MITANELREKFLRFFKEKGHAVIPSASLIPENDPTVLFTTAGMHPLVPYLMGQKHPEGTRLTDVQKCIRTGDIDEVGDASHLTFFEMLGNWSLNDYFKEEAIAWSWEFLTSPQWLGLPPERLAFSVFAGDGDVPADEESASIWRKLGVAPERIFYLPRENNWWGPAGMTGPCGPDTEMFIVREQEPCGPDCSPACDCGRYLEIWNDVFMSYNKTPEGTYEPLGRVNVDTGMGLERTIGVLQGVSSVYETDLFQPILARIEELSGKRYGEDKQVTRAMRIVADHIRTSTFILGDRRGVTPSNTDQGYILRRLIRRAVRFSMQLSMPDGFSAQVADVIVREYQAVYPELSEKHDFIREQLLMEEQRFQRTLEQGIREFDKIKANLLVQGLTTLDGPVAFRLYDTYGFPVEMTGELARENGLAVDMEGFKEAFEHHQKLSQQGAEQRFKGGLADHQVETARLHSATHLLHAALRRVLGDEVVQRGSNITAERLRFDFSFGRKMTAEEISEVQRLVNEAISQDLPITMREMTVDEARAEGAIGLFESRYGERVKVYTMGKSPDDFFTKEICGGPHAERTGELGGFTIQKEEASSAGVRRIKAVIGTVDAPNAPEKSGAAGETKPSGGKADQAAVEQAAQRAEALMESAPEIGGIKVLTAELPDMDGGGLRLVGDLVKDKHSAAVAVLACVSGEKVAFLAVCGKDAVAAGLKAGNIVREVAKIAGGSGGGRPDSAMAGGKDLTKVKEALEAVPGIVSAGK